MKSRRTYNLIYKTGLQNNIHFQFEKIKITPNSFGSHKLLSLAHKYNKQTEVLETLFYSYFIEGINIGDFDELVIISKQHNIYNESTLEYLKSNKDRKNLLAEENQARKLGIKGVPCFIINKEHIFFGAQEKKYLLEIFQKISV